MPTKAMPSKEVILQKLSFDPTNGVFYHLKSEKRSKRGSVAGTKQKNGYRILKINKKSYGAHRVAWFLFTGIDPIGKEVDHVNRDPSDNRPSNLRLVNKSQNQCNSKIRKDNTSGERGVYWYAPRKKWQVSVRLNGKDYFGGRFSCFKEAQESAKKLRLKIHGEYAVKEN